MKVGMIKKYMNESKERKKIKETMKGLNERK